MKEALVELPLRWSVLRISVFVPKIADEFVLGLEVLRAYNAAVDLTHRVLRMGEEVVIVASWGTTTIISPHDDQGRNIDSVRDCRD
jgi:hypothetical protein